LEHVAGEGSKHQQLSHTNSFRKPKFLKEIFYNKLPTDSLNYITQGGKKEKMLFSQH